MGESLKVTLHNIKTAAYETRHADGAMGGWTSQGLLFIAFYVERPPVPQALHIEVDIE
jgi:hypothetical protein